MPKQSIIFTRFEGVVGAADAHDLPVGTAAYAENLDPVTEAGLFAALPADSESGSNIGILSDVAVSTDFYGNTGSVLMVDQGDSNKIKLYVASGASFTYTSGANTRTGPDTAVSDGEAMHVGMGAGGSANPKWVGNIQHTQFYNIGGSVANAAPGRTTVDAVLARATFVGVHPTTTNITGALPDTFTADDGYVAYDNSQVGLRNDTVYVYYASMTYDFHQEGPLRPILVVRLGRGTLTILNEDASITAVGGVTAAEYETATVGGEFAAQAATGLKYLQMKVRVLHGTIPERVTGINIYRGENPLLGGAIWDSGLSTEDPFLIKQIDLAGTVSMSGTPTYDQWYNTSETGSGGGTWDSASAGVYAYFLLRDDGSVMGGTYGDRTGITPALETMQLHYSVSCASQGFHVVGRCYHPNMLNLENWIFRSKPGAFDQFDWTADYLKLSFRPNALVNYGGRVYAFGNARTAVINPGTLDIEDEWEGIGAPARKSIVVSDRGMFWADNANVYWHNGATVERIGQPILRNQFDANVGWLGLSRTSGNLTNSPVVGYDARYDAVFFFVTTGATAYVAWMFHIPTQRWVLVTFPSIAGGPWIHAWNRSDGRLMVMCGTATREIWTLFADTTNLRAWRWVSGLVADFARKSRLYHLYVAYKSSRPATIKAYVNNTVYTTGAESDNYFTVADWTTGLGGGKVDIGEMTNTTGGWIYARNFALDVAGAASTVSSHYNVQQMEVVHRPLGAR